MTPGDDEAIETLREGRSVKSCMAAQAARYEAKAERKHERRMRRRLKRIEEMGDEAFTYYPASGSEKEERGVDVEKDEIQKEVKINMNWNEDIASTQTSEKSKVAIAMEKEDKKFKAVISKTNGSPKTKKGKGGRAVSADQRGSSPDSNSKDSIGKNEVAARGKKYGDKKIKRANEAESKTATECAPRPAALPSRLRKATRMVSYKESEMEMETLTKQRRFVMRRASAEAAEDRIRDCAHFDNK